MSFPFQEQSRVINQTGRPLVVIAVAGTGKTSTIVNKKGIRFIYLKMWEGEKNEPVVIAQ